MSLENRFVIRPRGVVSKKDIGARRTRNMARFNITLLARVPKIEMETANKNMNMAWPAPRPA